MNKIAWLVAATLVVLAVALHAFYIDYEVDGQGYIVSWQATASQRHEVEASIARGRVRAPRSTVVEQPSNAEQIRQLRLFQQKNCTYRNGQPIRWDIAFFDDLICKVPYVPPQIKRTTVVTPGVSFSQALQQVQAELAHEKILFGARPSHAFAGDEPSRTSIQKSFWLGVLLPFVLIAAAACTLVLRRRSGALREAASSEGGPVSYGKATNDSDHKSDSLAERLRADLGSDFPVESGNGKRQDPLIVTAQSDYVGIEYAVVRHVLRAVREDFKLSTQSLIDEDGRKIDELVFDVKPIGAEEWAGQRRFYFDISAGYGRRD